jgi:IclR family pca regulon transcriptional regulator
VTATSSDFTRSLERGLAVINSFSWERPTQTLTQVAEKTGLTKGTARRILLTLGELGYIDQAGRSFQLTPRVLQLGYSSLSSARMVELARQPMQCLVDQLEESSSMSILDDTDIVHVAQVRSKRIMSIALGPGSRLPAYPTAMGRVLLAGLGNETVEERISRVELKRLTEHTISDRSVLKRTIERVRTDGFALVDQELETGVRSIAVPLIDSSGGVIAAVDLSCHATRVSLAELESEFIPRLLATAEEINVAARALGVRFT